jgi:hypothetical protein
MIFLFLAGLALMLMVPIAASMPTKTVAAVATIVPAVLV